MAFGFDEVSERILSPCSTAYSTSRLPLNGSILVFVAIGLSSDAEARDSHIG